MSIVGTELIKKPVLESVNTQWKIYETSIYWLCKIYHTYTKDIVHLSLRKLYV